MSKSKTENSAKIAIMGIVSQLITQMLNFVIRTIFIYSLGEIYLGLNGTFSSVLQLLSLTELGVGSAMLFYLYKPLAEHDKPRVKVLMSFYKKSYRIISLAILILGVCLIPFLPSLVNFKTELPENLYLIYILLLSNTVISYWLSAYKSTLLYADQKEYVTLYINAVVAIASSIVQGIVLFAFKNYVLFLCIKIFTTIVNNLIISYKVDKDYPFLKGKCEDRLSKEEIKEIFENVYSIFVLKVSSKIFSSSDNIVISACIGTVLAGFNDNYVLIMTTVNTILGKITSAFRASVGFVINGEEKNKGYSLFKNLDFVNFLVVAFSEVCFFVLLNPFIELWIGRNFILPQYIVALVVLVNTTSKLLEVVYIFRDGAGVFKHGKYKQLISGLLNICLSIVLAKVLGLSGIFVATIICQLFLSTPGYVDGLFTKGFNLKPIYYYKTMYKYLILIIGECGITYAICLNFDNNTIISFIIRGLICLVIPNVINLAIYWKDEKMKFVIEKVKYIMNLFLKKVSFINR